MDSNNPTGFREVPHAADWELEVWAPDLAMLLEQAARGMYVLMGAHLKPESSTTRYLELPAFDRESLLVGFLAELLYLGEVEGVGFDHFDLDLNEERLRARLTGAQIESLSKEIKAVTYHNLAIREAERGLEANIVFDV